MELFLEQVPGRRKLCDVNILKRAFFVAERQLSQLFLVGCHWASRDYIWEVNYAKDEHESFTSC
jgi:hypothetical protein